MVRMSEMHLDCELLEAAHCNRAIVLPSHGCNLPSLSLSWPLVGVSKCTTVAGQPLYLSFPVSACMPARPPTAVATEILASLSVIDIICGAQLYSDRH